VLPTASFILRTLETILPSLEGNLDNISDAMELMKLAKSLLFALDFESEAFKRGDLADLMSDRLFSLYQFSLRAIASTSPNPELKEYYYSISYRYLIGMSDVVSLAGFHRRPTMKTIKAAGDRFIDVICDDAYSGEPVCRISALLLLTTLVKMAQKENDIYAIEALVRLNFVAILVDSVSKMPSDLAQTPREGTRIQNFLCVVKANLLCAGVPMHLKYCHVRLVLLGNIAQTRPGATAVLNAGLFYSIQESNLFARDPDLVVGKF
jgi:nuclear pore complex protein Nup205